MAHEATPGPWRRGPEPSYEVLGPGEIKPVEEGDSGGGAADWDTADWIATFSPAIAEPLAAWLEFEADSEPSRSWFNLPANALARQILEASTDG